MKEMKLILLSGGSGKRLWPLSNHARSKQFLKVLRNPDLQMESMVQRVWRQLKSANLAESTFLATCKEQVDAIRNHLGSEVPLIIEPERRDTFPAIALASVYLFSHKNVESDETICVMPVDCFVEQPFFQKIHEFDSLLNRTGSSLGLMGTQPTYPSPKYGYLVPNAGYPDPANIDYFEVSRFIEKPDEGTARLLVEGNALWNCGVFAFKLGFILSLLERKGWPTRYEELVQRYESLPVTSFDYQVVEKTNKIVALTYTGKWKDLGTWNTLTEEMDTPILGKGVISDDSSNTHVINELDIPVTVLGTNGLVVACSPDGILVSDKAASYRLKDWIQTYTEMPKFAETPWGWYRILDHSVYPAGQEVLIRKIGVRSGCHMAYHFHRNRSEHWKLLRGEGLLVLDDRIIAASAGDDLVIPVGTRHALRAITDLELIEVQAGRPTDADEIRIFTDWGDLETFIQGDRNSKL